MLMTFFSISVQTEQEFIENEKTVILINVEPKNEPVPFSSCQLDGCCYGYKSGSNEI